MALYGVGLDVSAQKLNLDFKLYIAKQQGGASLRNIKQIFEQYDRNGNGKLEAEEFQKGLNTFGFFMKKTDLQTYFQYYDRNGDGVISYDQFISAIREPLNERRLNLVVQVFASLDKDGSRFISAEELADRYDPTKNHDFLTGQQQKDELVNDFMSLFQIQKDGKISLNEFINYYTDLSVGYPSDQQFIELINNSWGVKEDEQSEINKQEVQFIVKTLRQKLVQMTSGTHEEFLLRQIFQEFDLNKSGYLNLDELYAMMIKLECPIHQQYLSAVFNQFDANKSGTIQFEEFVNYIVNDPYP